MQSAQEFLESYLREKAELLKQIRQMNLNLYGKFFAKDLVEYISERHASKDKTPESFSLAEVADDSATIVTTEFISKMQTRHRYHLRKSTDNSEIHKKERECFVCDGTGRGQQKLCHHCGGVGWRDCYPDAS